MTHYCRDCQAFLPAASFYASYAARGIAYCRTCHHRRVTLSRRKHGRDRKRAKVTPGHESTCLAQLRYQARCHVRRDTLGRTAMSPIAAPPSPAPVARAADSTADTISRSAAVADPNVVISINTAQVRDIFARWHHRSAFDWLGMSPAILRRKSRAKDPAVSDGKLTLVVWRWPAGPITPADVIPVTRREARIWHRRPELFENSSSLIGCIDLQRDAAATAAAT